MTTWASAAPAAGGPQANRFPGPCYFCGAKVPAGAGVYGSGQVRHLPGRCKTTTKTYRDTIAAAWMGAYREVVARMWADAGYNVFYSHRVEHADEITGHGLRALVGGDKSAYEIGEHGVRVYRGGALVGEHPRPRIDTGDYFADWVAQAAATIAILDSYREGA
jgi:ribosomal protein L24E